MARRNTIGKPAEHAYRELTVEQRRKLIALRALLAKGRAMLKAREAERNAA